MPLKRFGLYSLLPVAPTALFCLSSVFWQGCQMSHLMYLCIFPCPQKEGMGLSDSRISSSSKIIWFCKSLMEAKYKFGFLCLSSGTLLCQSIPAQQRPILPFSSSKYIDNFFSRSLMSLPFVWNPFSAQWALLLCLSSYPCANLAINYGTQISGAHPSRWL